jgi:glycerophosphoryl diester phosphodiesterase
MAPRSLSAKQIHQQREIPLLWPPLKIGRRGAAGEAPENTFASFKLALREGAEGIILDVQLSSDGVPVVISSEALGRTASGRNRLRQRAASALIQLDAGSWFNHRFPSRAKRQYVQESVPLLFEVLHWVREQKCMALIALNRPTPEAEARVLKEIARAKVHHLTRVIAANLPSLTRLRRLDPKVNVGLQISSRPPAIRKAKALGAEVLLPHWKKASPSLIQRAHRASMLVIPWTVDTLRQMRRIILQGADGIITNYPAKLSEAVSRLQRTLRAKRANQISKKEFGTEPLVEPPQTLASLRLSVQRLPATRPSKMKEML